MAIRRLARFNVAKRRRLGGVWSDTPDDITHVIGNQQRAVPIHRDADGPAHGFARSIDEAAQHVFRLPGRLAIAKGNEHHLVAATGPAVP